MFGKRGGIFGSPFGGGLFDSKGHVIGLVSAKYVSHTYENTIYFSSVSEQINYFFESPIERPVTRFTNIFSDLHEKPKGISGSHSAAFIQLLLLQYQPVLACPYHERIINRSLALRRFNRPRT